MSWSEIMLYITAADAEQIRDWLNDETAVAWIVPTSESAACCRWRAVDRLHSIEPGQYTIWYRSSPLTLPSGEAGVSNVEILDPYRGWSQPHGSADVTPMFGAQPWPPTFTFREAGRETAGSLARSGFHWAGDHFRLLGMPAHPETKRWWQRLKRFVAANAEAVPWPYGDRSSRLRAHAFADAYSQIVDGRPVDTNPV